jgi:hypothetical protein
MLAFFRGPRERTTSDKNPLSFPGVQGPDFGLTALIGTRVSSRTRTGSKFNSARAGFGTDCAPMLIGVSLAFRIRAPLRLQASTPDGATNAALMFSS